LGSVKSNLGHLEAAAGVAGLIKTALAFRHRRLPASLHFQTPNPHIPFESLGLAVEQASGPWPDGPAPAVAGVSSFGFGGTNVHLVVEDAPTPAAPLPRDQEDDRPLLIPLSAHTEAALTAVARRFRDAVVSHQDDAEVALGDLCFTTALRRTHLQHRRALARSRASCFGRRRGGRRSS
jgi:acyl transferase domain-containing protein